jgi:hypothetical protein
MPHQSPIQLTNNRQNYHSSTMPAFICLFALIISLVGYTSISEAASGSQVELASAQNNISVTTPTH